MVRERVRTWWEDRRGRPDGFGGEYGWLLLLRFEAAVTSLSDVLKSRDDLSTMDLKPAWALLVDMMVRCRTYIND